MEHADIVMPAPWHYSHTLHLLNVGIAYCQGPVENQSPLLSAVSLHSIVEVSLLN